MRVARRRRECLNLIARSSRACWCQTGGRASRSAFRLQPLDRGCAAMDWKGWAWLELRAEGWRHPQCRCGTSNGRAEEARGTSEYRAERGAVFQVRLSTIASSMLQGQSSFRTDFPKIRARRLSFFPHRASGENEAGGEISPVRFRIADRSHAGPRLEEFKAVGHYLSIFRGSVDGIALASAVWRSWRGSPRKTSEVWAWKR